MANVIIPRGMSTEEKITLMRQDARYDVTDQEAPIAAECLGQIRQNIRGVKALPKVPKVFLSNDCIFNCAYCDCRQGKECRRYGSTPRELAELAYRQAIGSGHGIFITSAIIRTPDYTEELIIETMKILRRQMGYTGYLHAKVMPGTDPALIREAGRYANRLSVNIEVAQSEAYRHIARNKNKQNILTPMGQISEMIARAKADASRRTPAFAMSQTTQMMAGSMGEDDFTILNLSGALYQKYRLSRIYYTAFQYLEHAKGYDHLREVRTPAWRMARLYQADRLMQLYGFTAEEIAPPTARHLSQTLDPKAAWAMRNLHLFPLEVNRAEYEQLLRVPGIGVTYAERIIQARRYGPVTHDTLRALGIAQKRCRHFITCGGKYTGDTCEQVEQLSFLLADSVERAAS